MGTIKEIMQVGVIMPDREAFARFSRDMLGFPTSDSRGRKSDVCACRSLSPSPDSAHGSRVGAELHWLWCRRAGCRRYKRGSKPARWV